MDLIPRLQRGVVQDPSMKQKTQHHPCASFTLSETPVEKAKDFVDGRNDYVNDKVFVTQSRVATGLSFGFVKLA